MREVDGFAVVDVETTGFSRNDRIIEIAIIRTDRTGRPLDEYVTLINPHRDVGPTRIHGITASQVKQAPTFDEVAGDVVSRLAGGVFVAHNALFDKRFVCQEFERLSCSLPDFPCLCTMRLASEIDPSIPGRRLEIICRHFGIAHQSAHSAYHDALAEASLLALFLERKGDLLGASSVDGTSVQDSPRELWPSLPVSGKSWRRNDAELRPSELSYIAKLIAALPAGTEAPQELQAYLGLLDRVLEDRSISPTEVFDLLECCGRCKISRDVAVQAHESYLLGLFKRAFSDGEISPDEREDLDRVASILAIPAPVYQSLMRQAKGEIAGQGDTQSGAVRCACELQGKRVCFTGELSCLINGEAISREQAESMAAKNGMIVQSYVTKSLDYLVAADPNTESTKARKARQYGVEVIAESTFWQMLGVYVE